MKELIKILREIAIQLQIRNLLKNKSGYYQFRLEAIENLEHTVKIDE